MVATVTMEEICAELILNWDKTGINIAPSSAWTLEQKGSNRVEMTGVTNKCQITAVFCGSHTGDFLPLQLVYKRKMPQCQFFSGLLTHRSTGQWSRPCCSTFTTLFCLACGRWANDCTWVMINQQLQLLTILRGRSQKLSQVFLRPTISMSACYHSTLLIFFSP